MTVDPSYRHHRKTAAPSDSLAIGTSELKWYQIACSGQPIPSELSAKARAFVASEGFGGRLALDDDRGVVILHRCGDTFFFLLVSIWRGSNELWEAVYYRDAGMDGFAPFEPGYPTAGMLRPTFCVWELGVVAHEAKVWVDYLFSARTDDDLARWRDTRYYGDV